MKTEIKYALRNKKTGELVGYYTDSNEGSQDCVGIRHILSLGSLKKTWYADSPEHAEFVRLNDTNWYNASYETPSHGTNIVPQNLEVVELTINIETEPCKVKLPSPLEYYEWLYGKGGKHENIPHLDYLKEVMKNQRLSLSWYDICEWIREHKKE